MKAKYDPKKVTIIIILGLLFFLIMGFLYEKKNGNTWLICTTNNDYNEKLKFKYVKGYLTKYYREEYFSFKSKTDLEKWQTYFNDEKKKLTLNENFKYQIIVDNFDLTVKTYINVVQMKAFFNQYMNELGINGNNSIKEIRSLLEGKEYTCSLKYN